MSDIKSLVVVIGWSSGVMVRRGRRDCGASGVRHITGNPQKQLIWLTESETTTRKPVWDLPRATASM